MVNYIDKKLTYITNTNKSKTYNTQNNSQTYYQLKPSVMCSYLNIYIYIYLPAKIQKTQDPALSTKIKMKSRPIMICVTKKNIMTFLFSVMTPCRANSKPGINKTVNTI